MSGTVGNSRRHVCHVVAHILWHCDQALQPWIDIWYDTNWLIGLADLTGLFTLMLKKKWNNQKERVSTSGFYFRLLLSGLNVWGIYCIINLIFNFSSNNSWCENLNFPDRQGHGTPQIGNIFWLVNLSLDILLVSLSLTQWSLPSTSKLDITSPHASGQTKLIEINVKLSISSQSLMLNISFLIYLSDDDF